MTKSQECNVRSYMSWHIRDIYDQLQQIKSGNYQLWPDIMSWALFQEGDINSCHFPGYLQQWGIIEKSCLGEVVGGRGTSKDYTSLQEGGGGKLVEQ